MASEEPSAKKAKADVAMEQIARSAALMNGENGFDVVIVCTNTSKMAQYWQTRLEKGRGSIVPAKATILSVFEDWPGGAGNALGTLYAWQKACAQFKDTTGQDLAALLSTAEVSCAIYHTAGKGTRLAPLPGAENNNKPGVKLPVTLPAKDVASAAPISILEAVVQQTGIYAASRKGRLSVFWGDQVFIPSVAPGYTPKHHVDILCALGPMVGSSEEWQAKGLDKYGLIAVGDKGEAAQVEKVSHGTAVRLLAGLGSVASVGASLGSFSVSSAMLALLMDEHKEELAAKQGKLDTDPGLWMPLTLSQEAYVEIMGQKGVAAAEAEAQHQRMTKMRARLPEGGLGLLGAVDVGTAAYWWDYGQLKLYTANNLKLLLPDDNHEANTMRAFFKLPASRINASELGEGVEVSGGSCVSASRVGSGRVAGSLVSQVTAKRVECGEGCILVNVTAASVTCAPNCVVYNVTCTDPEGLTLDEPGAVLTTALLPAAAKAEAGAAAAGAGAGEVEAVRMASHVDTDGGSAWKAACHGNAKSFEEVYTLNGDADVTAMETHAADLHATAKAALGL